MMLLAMPNPKPSNVALREGSMPEIESSRYMALKQIPGPIMGMRSLTNTVNVGLINVLVHVLQRVEFSALSLEAQSSWHS